MHPRVVCVSSALCVRGLVESGWGQGLRATEGLKRNQPWTICGQVLETEGIFSVCDECFEPPEDQPILPRLQNLL